jgi:hypothetical protein
MTAGNIVTGKRISIPASGRHLVDMLEKNAPHNESIHLFLIGYFILIVGVGRALWQAGVLNRVAPIWLGIGAIVAAGLGIMLSVSSGKPTVTGASQK